MKTTGEFKKLNLIPVKKAVVDPHKGIMLRTYYVNPHKYVQTTLKSKLEKSSIYITRYNDNIDKAIKNNNIHFLKNEFRTDNDWNILINRRIEYNNSEFNYSNNDLQLYATNILNFTTTLDTYHLVKSKKLVKNANKEYFLNENTKLKKQKKLKIKVKEKTVDIPQHLNYYNLINELDNSFVQHTYKLNKDINPIKTGLYVSKIINMINPKTAKLIQILLHITEKKITDKYHIGKNIYILPYHIVSESDFFKSYLTTIIYNSETMKDEDKFKYLDEKVLIYNYFLTSLIDNNLFNDLLHEFKRNTIIMFIKNKMKDTNLIDYWFSKFIYYIFYPDITEIIDDIISNIKYNNITTKDKYFIIACLSARTDVTHTILEKLFYLLDITFDFENSIKNFDRYLRGFNNELYLEDMLLQQTIAIMSNIKYFPFAYYDSLIPVNNPFSFVPLTKISVMYKDISNKIKKSFLSNLPTIITNETNNIIYIPLRNINRNHNNIAYQLLPLQIAYTDINNLTYSIEIPVDFIPVKVNQYKKIDDKMCLILPHNLII